MEDLGPAWFLEELPYPIALSWQVATRRLGTDGMELAKSIEVALRVVGGLQVAAHLAVAKALPGELGEVRFNDNKGTFGAWIEVVTRCRNALSGLANTELLGPFEVLARWPSPAVERQLHAIRDRRNAIAHEAFLPATTKAELDRAIAVEAEAVLDSLAWLRQLELCAFADGVRHGERRGLSRELIYKGTSSSPLPRLVAWEGELQEGRFYARMRQGERHALLVVDPFVGLSRPGKTVHPVLCVWRAIARDGKVIARGVGLDAEVALELGEPSAIATVQIIQRPDSSTSMTRYGSEPLQPRVGGLTSEGGPVQLRPSRRRTWPWVLGGLLLVLGLTLAALLAVGVEWDGAPGPETHAEGSPAAGMLEAARPTSTCSPPEIMGIWSVDTIVLGTKAGKESKRGVRGHYEVGIDRDGCWLSASVRKTGWVEVSGKRFKTDQRGRATLVQTSRSAASSFELTSAKEGGAPALIAFRWAKAGPWVVGLFRYVGRDLEEMGYWGTAFGLPVALEDTPPDTRCFEDCAERCFAGRDPLDEGTEPCLLDCSRELSGCSR